MVIPPYATMFPSHFSSQDKTPLAPMRLLESWFGGNASSDRESSRLAWSIPWAFEPEAPPGALKHPVFLLTDVPGMTRRDLEQVIAMAKPTGRAIVFVTPGLDPGATSVLGSPEVFAIRATSLPGQPVAEILEDLAVVTGGSALLQELCAGVSVELSLHEDSLGGLVIPRWKWSDVQTTDLGSADALSRRNESLVWTCMGSEEIARRCETLKHELVSTREAEARKGIVERLVRLGEATASSEGAPPEIAGDGDIVLPAGYASRYFVNDPEHSLVVLEDARVLLSDSPLREVGPLLTVMKEVVAQPFPLLVVSPVVADAALATLVLNKMRGILPSVAVSLGSDRVSLSGLAQAIGAKILTEKERGDGVLASLGRARRVRVGKSQTIVTAPNEESST